MHRAPLWEIKEIFPADGIREDYPGVYIDTLAYQMTQQPPKTIRPRDNVIIRVAELNAEWGRESDLFHPITHPVNKAQLQRLQGWSKIAKNIADAVEANNEAIEFALKDDCFDRDTDVA